MLISAPLTFVSTGFAYEFGPFASADDLKLMLVVDVEQRRVRILRLCDAVCDVVNEGLA